MAKRIQIVKGFPQVEKIPKVKLEFIDDSVYAISQDGKQNILLTIQDDGRLKLYTLGQGFQDIFDTDSMNRVIVDS